MVSRGAREHVSKQQHKESLSVVHVHRCLSLCSPPPPPLLARDVILAVCVLAGPMYQSVDPTI